MKSTLTSFCRRGPIEPGPPSGQIRCSTASLSGGVPLTEAVVHLMIGEGTTEGRREPERTHCPQESVPVPLGTGCTRAGAVHHRHNWPLCCASWACRARSPPGELRPGEWLPGVDRERHTDWRERDWRTPSGRDVGMGYHSQPDAACIPTVDRVKHERGPAGPGVDKCERLPGSAPGSLSEHQLHLRPAHLAPPQPALRCARSLEMQGDSRSKSGTPIGRLWRVVRFSRRIRDRRGQSHPMRPLRVSHRGKTRRADRGCLRLGRLDH